MSRKAATLAERGMEDFAPYLMNRVMGRYNARIREQLRQAGISVTQMRALAVLSVYGAASVNDLATMAVVEQSTLSRSLDKMQEDGWVERRADDSDSRVRLVHLLPDGRKVWERVWPHLVSAESDMFAGVPEEARETFLATLNQVLKNIRRNPI